MITHKHKWNNAGYSGGGLPVRQCLCGATQMRSGIGGRWVYVVGPVR